MIPETCALCRYSNKVEDPLVWCCGKDRDTEGFYTFRTIQRGWKKLPVPPQWCPLRKRGKR